MLQLLHINILRYITFRSACALLISFFTASLLMPCFIRNISKLYPLGQPIRDVGPKSHLETKKKTPTGGGVVMLLGFFAAALLTCDLSNPYVLIVLWVGFACGLLGGLDDYHKISRSNHFGVSGKKKLLAQVAIAAIAITVMQKLCDRQSVTTVALPFFKNAYIDLAWLYIPFACLVITGTSNAVNLTDGLDGLVSMPVVLASLTLAVMSYLCGNRVFAEYLYIPHVAGSGELTVMCAAIAGSVLGFLWHNAHPARVFMGDVGSLSLGGMLGAISVAIRQEITFAIVGGLFVLEALSVMIQVCYFRWSGGKRVFLMAPLHHHFEQKGWRESQVIVRFWIIAAMFALLGLLTLKLR